MKKLTLIFFLIFSAHFLPAQEFLFDLNSDTAAFYMPIEGFPKAELPDGVDSLFFVYFQEEAVLGYAVCKEEKLYLVKRFDQDEDIWFNWAKADYVGIYDGGRVQFCSQLPFRATIACDMFKWTGKTFEYDETDLTDPSAESVTEAEALREAGHPCEAIDKYDEVMYPHAYFNADDVFSELLIECHTVALKHYREKAYNRAVITMDCIMNNAWIDFSENFVSNGEWVGPEVLSRQKYIDIMGDYGLFLVRAKQYKEAVEINQALLEFEPEVIGPMLQLGDAQYHLGQVDNAKTTYTAYHRKMAAAGKASKVPSRVTKRM